MLRRPQHCRSKSLNPKQQVAPLRPQYDRTKMVVAVQHRIAEIDFGIDLENVIAICAVTNRK
jgi:hypothetical protein